MNELRSEEQCFPCKGQIIIFWYKPHLNFVKGAGKGF